MSSPKFSTPIPNFKSPVNQSDDLDQSDINQSDHLNSTTETSNHGIRSVHVGRHGYQSSEEAESRTISPSYTEQWEDYMSPRKHPATSRLSQATHRSRESGRLSPTVENESIEIGTQPLTLPRFNEPLKLRKGRQFVDYEAPAPTVVYVPHRSFAHGPWSNVSVQKKGGRYVVIEQRPVHTQFTESSQVKQLYAKDIFGHETSWTKKKSPWTWSSRGNFIERSVNRGFYEPYLPPIKSKFNSVTSKVGSLDNYSHKPGGGTHKVPSFKLKWDAQAKIGSLPNTERDQFSGSPGSSLKLPSISPRYGASADSGGFLTSVHYEPGGKVILKRTKYDVRSLVGSLDNIHHEPHGGNVTIPSNSTNWDKKSKVGSLDNITHLPKSSNVQIFKEKLEWKKESKLGSLDNADHSPRRRRFKVPNFHKKWNETATPKVGSLTNASHTPKGGNVQIIDKKVKWTAKPKVQSHWKMNFDYQSLFGGDDSELDASHFNETASYPFTV